MGEGNIKMFIDWVSVAIGQALEYELLELSLGDWDSSRWEEALELALAFPKKNGRCLGGPPNKKY
jgi:hypothetical protein